MSNLYKNITATGPTLVCAGRAILSRVILNTSNSGNVTVYDYNAATGMTGSNVAIVNAGTTPVSTEYEIDMQRGIAIKNATGSQDITISYRPA